MKKHNQSKEDKANFKSELLDLWFEFNGGRRITRQELMGLWHKNDRTVRDEVSRIANYFAVITTSIKRGYELALTPDLIAKNPYALKRQCDEISATLKMFESMKQEICAREKPLIANQEVCVKYLSEIEKEEVQV
jgi:hypothetical protein